jgi:hypothetical protein
MAAKRSKRTEKLPSCALGNRRSVWIADHMDAGQMILHVP